MWIVGFGLCAGVGVAYGAAYNLAVGLAAFLPLAGISLALLVAASPVVIVTSATLRAGRAVIPMSALDRCAPLDSLAMRRALRMGEPSLYLMVRPWSVNQGVIIELADPHDPHTSWVLSSRHPTELVRALEQGGVREFGVDPGRG